LFQKVKELKIRDNDTYFMESVGDRVVINKNYEGILVLDNQLTGMNEIPLFPGLKIYSSLYSHAQNSIMLLCPENDCLVFADLKAGHYDILPIEKHEIGVFNTRLYIWYDDIILLSTPDGVFYEYVLGGNKLAELDGEEIDNDYPKFYSFWSTTRKYTPIDISHTQYGYIYGDRITQEYGFYDFDRNTERNIRVTDIEPEEILYRNGIWVLGAENQIRISTEKVREDSSYSYDQTSVRLPEGYHIRKVRFLNFTHHPRVIALVSGPHIDSEMFLEIFELSR